MRTLAMINPIKTSLKPMSFDSLLEDFWGNAFQDFPALTGTSMTPSVNITETADAFHLELAAPGLQKEDFDISIKDNRITIAADKKSESHVVDDNKRITRREFNYTSFSRSFTLSDAIDQRDIKAHYENGILSVELKKKEEAKQIETKISID